MQAQTEAAIAAADAVFFVIDARAGHDADRPGVRRSGAPLGQARDPGRQQERGPGRRGRRARSLCARAWRAGRDLGRARRGARRSLRGAARDLARRRRRQPARRNGESRAERPINVAVVGRPNSGKSTLVNRLLGEERLLTGPEAGITRDAIAVDARLARAALPHARHGRTAAALRGSRRSSKSSRSPTRSMPFASPRS